jgi:MFS family permease
VTSLTATPVRAIERRTVLGMAGVMGLGTWLGFAFGVLSPFLVRDLGLRDVEIGALPSLMYATGALLAGSAGRLVDHIGPRRTCLLVPPAVAVANLGFGLAPNWAALVAAAIVGGVGLASTNPATNRLVVEAVPVASRGAAMGWKQAGVSASSFLVGALLPSIATRWDWRAAAVFGSVVSFLVWSLLGSLLPSPDREEVGGESPEGGASTARVVGTPAYAAILGAVNGALSAYLVLYGVRDLGNAETVAGWGAAALGLAALGARVGWATIGTRSGRPVWWLRTIAVLAALSFLSLSLLPPAAPALFVAASAMLGLSAVSWQALLMAAAVEGVPVSRVGRVSGTVTRAFYGGYVVGPLILGLAADAGTSYRILWAALGGVCLGAVAVVRWSDR